MRWTDLPRDSGPADDRASALPRGEWEELRRRLERLPDGHPSRPDDEPDAPAAEDVADEGFPDEESARPGAADGGPADTRDRKPADPHDRARGPAGADSGHGRPAGLGDLARWGDHEPYRPWFSGGEPPEPWFVAEPD